MLDRAFIQNAVLWEVDIVVVVNIALSACWVHRVSRRVAMLARLPPQRVSWTVQIPLMVPVLTWPFVQPFPEVPDEFHHGSRLLRNVTSRRAALRQSACLPTPFSHLKKAL